MLILSCLANIILIVFALILWKRQLYYRNRLVVIRKLMRSKVADMNKQRMDLQHMTETYKSMLHSSENRRLLEKAYRESEG